MVELLITVAGALLVVTGIIVLAVRLATRREARTTLDFLGPLTFAVFLIAIGVFLIIGTGRLW